MTNLFVGRVATFLLKTSPVESAMGQSPGHLLADGVGPWITAIERPFLVRLSVSEVESTVTSPSHSNRYFRCLFLLRNPGRYWPWITLLLARRPRFCRNEWVQQLLGEVHVANFITTPTPGLIIIVTKLSGEIRICGCTVCTFFLLKSAFIKKCSSMPCRWMFQSVSFESLI